MGFARAGLPSWQTDANVAARWFKRVCRSLCLRTGPGHGAPSIAASVRSHQRRSAGRGPLPSPRALCPTGCTTSSRCSRVKVDVAGARICPATAFPRAYPPNVHPGWIPHTLSPSPPSCAPGLALTSWLMPMCAGFGAASSGRADIEILFRGRHRGRQRRHCHRRRGRRQCPRVRAGSSRGRGRGVAGRNARLWGSEAEFRAVSSLARVFE